MVNMMMSELYENTEILISWLSEYSYCKRRFYIKVMENNSGINQFIAEGIIDHKSVDKSAIERRRSLVKVTRLNVYSNEYHLKGVCDNVEFLRDEAGGWVDFLAGKYIPVPIEYKHGKIRNESEYQIQLMGQAMCLEEMYDLKLDHGFIYYTSSRHRDRVDFTDELREKTINTIYEILAYFEKPIAPEAIYKKRCYKCSVYDLCSPKNKMIEKYMAKQRLKL